MADPVMDLNALTDQVKTLTEQVATLQFAQKKLAGDLNIRFEQLKDRIDKQTDGTNIAIFRRLGALEHLPSRDVLDFEPQLDGDWVAGATSPDFALSSQVSVSGSMSVDLPNLSTITRLICSCKFNGPSDVLPQVVVTLRRTFGDSSDGLPSAQIQRDVLTIIQLINNESKTTVEGSLDGSVVTFEGSPFRHNGADLDTHLVQSDTYDYSIQAELTFSGHGIVASAGGVVVPKGFVVLRGFQVVCIRASV